MSFWPVCGGCAGFGLAPQPRTHFTSSRMQVRRSGATRKGAGCLARPSLQRGLPVQVLLCRPDAAHPASYVVQARAPARAPARARAPAPAPAQAPVPYYTILYYTIHPRTHAFALAFALADMDVRPLARQPRPLLLARRKLTAPRLAAQLLSPPATCVPSSSSISRCPIAQAPLRCCFTRAVHCVQSRRRHWALSARLRAIPAHDSVLSGPGIASYVCSAARYVYAVRDCPRQGALSAGLGNTHARRVPWVSAMQSDTFLSLGRSCNWLLDAVTTGFRRCFDAETALWLEHVQVTLCIPRFPHAQRPGLDLQATRSAESSRLGGTHASLLTVAPEPSSLDCPMAAVLYAVIGVLPVIGTINTSFSS
jgi:hypothetical protein